jgi:signal transduction histidine kinase
VLERDGLAEAIQVLTDRAPVLVELRAAELPRLDDAIERAAYFVVAESLTNSLKYADASRIVIELAVVDDQLRVCITDDGSGFDVAGNGSGLQGLRDRAATAQGELTIVSTPGQGTTITGIFPATLSTRVPTR